MPDQYGPYRHFQRNMQALKKELIKEEKALNNCRARFNATLYMLISHRITTLQKSIKIMER